MKRDALQTLISPVSGSSLELASVEQEIDGEIVEGSLRDPVDRHLIPIRNAIPRFVDGGNYADSFGLQWNKYRRVQLDSFNGQSLTRNRFYAGTCWSPGELKGKRVLEAGCGAGRFSEILLEAGADLYSIDYSSAVDAAWENNKLRGNWSLSQADIYRLPFRQNSFDYVFCYGVLQHTPDPRRAFLNLARYLKPGAKIAVDVYLRPPRISRLIAGVWSHKPSVKYWYRPLTKRIPNHLLLRLFELYLPYWLPVDTLLQKIPRIGRFLSALVPCWNMSKLPLPPELRRAWTILDTFDAFSCEFDFPQTVPSVEGWFAEAGLGDVSVRPGGNGVLGDGTKLRGITDRP